MKKVKVISIIGMGLVGGSLGMALKRADKALKVIGVGRNNGRLRKAKELGAADEVTTDFCGGVREADLVVVAVPVEKTVEIIKKTVKCLKKGAVVTDAGSVKGKLVKASERLMPEGVNFVGSHPMAGSEKTGIENAVKDLYRGSTCIVTKTGRTNKNAMESVKRMWKKAGARVLVKTPREHDRLVAEVSHLPHLLSFSMMSQIGKIEKKEKDLSKITAGAYRDMTRISASSPELWADIFYANREFIHVSASIFIRNLKKINEFLRKGDKENIIKEIKKANAVKKRIDARIPKSE